MDKDELTQQQRDVMVLVGGPQVDEDHIDTDVLQELINLNLVERNPIDQQLEFTDTGQVVYDQLV